MRYFVAVSTVKEIEQAIDRLPAQEQWSLFQRLKDNLWDEWDAEIEADYQAGRLDALIAEAREDIAAGRTKPLDEVLRDE